MGLFKKYYCGFSFLKAVCTDKFFHSDPSIQGQGHQLHFYDRTFSLGIFFTRGLFHTGCNKHVKTVCGHGANSPTMAPVSKIKCTSHFFMIHLFPLISSLALKNQGCILYANCTHFLFSLYHDVTIFIFTAVPSQYTPLQSKLHTLSFQFIP